MSESENTVNLSALYQQRLGLETHWAKNLPADYLAGLPGAQTTGKQANVSRVYDTPTAGPAAGEDRVITSDHAAALGDLGKYGVSSGARIGEVVAGRAPAQARGDEQPVTLREVMTMGRRNPPTPALYGHPKHRKEDREPVRHRRARRHIVAFAAGAALVGGGIFAATELFPQKTSQVKEWLTDRSDEIADTIYDNL